MALPPVVALEIGTTKIAVLVGELREDGHLIIIGSCTHESHGVRKGEIVDLENATLCVRSAIEEAEKSGDVEIGEVFLAVTGGHIRSLVNKGLTPVLGQDGVIGEEDVEEAMKVAKHINISEDREALHTICQHYRIDDQEYIINPLGMEGTHLELSMLILHGIRSRIRNTSRAVTSIPIGVADVVFSGLCAGLAVLTPEQKQSGAIVIDLGGGTTDYVAYAQNVVKAAGCLGVGGDHVSNDIALAFNILSSRAEMLKKQNGSAVRKKGRETQSVELAAEVGFSGRNINLDALDTVINMRMEETLEMIKRQLSADDILPHIGAGVVLTGGGAMMNGITQLASDVFELPCSIGRPRNISGVASITENPEYAVCCGLIQHGFKQTLDRKGSIFRGIKRIFGR